MYFLIRVVKADKLCLLQMRRLFLFCRVSSFLSKLVPFGAIAQPLTLIFLFPISKFDYFSKILPQPVQLQVTLFMTNLSSIPLIGQFERWRDWIDFAECFRSRNGESAIGCD
jgi:hypothetical protein